MFLDTTIDQLITEQAKKNPQGIAIKFGGQSISYKNLSAQANKLANLLISNNIQAGDTVALAVDRSIEMVVALWAILKAGAGYLPLDPNFPIERLNFMLADSGAKLLFTSKRYQRVFETPTTKLLIEDFLDKLDVLPDTDPGVKIQGNDIAYLLYTSGSSGKPKGVEIEHHSLLNLLLSIQKKPGLTSTDVWLAVATISFDIATLEVLLPLITGATLIIATSEMAKDGHMLLDTISEQKVTVVQATPYTWRIMLAAGWKDKLPIRVMCGGEAMPKDLADKLIPRCSELWNLYGPTETTIYSTGKQILATDTIITIGKPIDNTQVYIVDEALNELTDGEEGEILIGGEGVGRGYLNRPELTAEKFIADKFTGKTNTKVYRTGDLGRITPEGEIQYLGRLDNQVKIRGFRIETEEIAYNLIQQDIIQNAVVVVNEDHLGNQRLLAYLVMESDIKPIDKSGYTVKWIAALKDKLPDYMVPTDYIILPDFPLTPSGKIDRKSLPKPNFNVSHSTFAHPESEYEKMITDLWIKYLGNPKIGINDNFFQLGGHSLIAVQIMTSIGNLTGKLLPIATLFKYPTIQKLASLLRSDADDNTWKSLVPIKASGSKMPLYIIHGEGLNVLIFNNIAQNVDVGQPVYGLQSRGLNGVDDPPESIEAMASRYIEEILEQNPNGPYAIAGYSFGGYIAIEMAKQFRAKDKEVKFLAMFDANFKLPESQISVPELVWQKGIRQVNKGAFVISSFVKQPSLTLEYQTLLIKKKLQRFGLFKDIDPENIPDYMQHIVDKLRQSINNYKMTPYDGVIHLFKAKNRIYFIDDPKFLGWTKFALKGVKVHEVPGDHRDMLLPPNDKEFSKVLQQCLDGVA